jgi:hypothetical protein
VVTQERLEQQVQQAQPVLKECRVLPVQQAQTQLLQDQLGRKDLLAHKDHKANKALLGQQGQLGQTQL